MPLTHPESRYLLYCFEWTPRWWERGFIFDGIAMLPGEAKSRFEKYFEIEMIIESKPDYSTYPPGSAVYLMKRK